MSNGMLSVLVSWLPYTAKRAIGVPPSRSETKAELSELLKHPGLSKLASNSNVKPVLGAARMLSPDSMLPVDHLFTALLKTGLIKDMLFLFNAQEQESYLVVDLGKDTCGHAKITHGGLLSSICDEAIGALVYCLKQQGKLGPEPAVTANLSVNYRKPVPGAACLLATAKMPKMEGRKMYLEASIDGVDTGLHYVDATALFINMKPKPKAEAEAGAAASEVSTPKIASSSKPLGDLDLGTDRVEQWHTEPRYQSVLKSIGM